MTAPGRSGSRKVSWEKFLSLLLAAIPANIPNISPTHVKLNVRVVNFPFWPHASVLDGWNAMGLTGKAGVKRLEVNRNIYSGHFSPQISAQFCQKFWAKSRRVVHCAYVCNWADRSWVAVPLWSSPFIWQISGPAYHLRAHRTNNCTTERATLRVGFLGLPLVIAENICTFVWSIKTLEYIGF